MRPRFVRAFAPALRNLQYVKRRMRPLAVVASVGFPLYYYVWKDLFPQPYENLTLRLIGSLLFVPILAFERWPAALKKLLPWYWYFATLYALPFFFTFMLLKNNGNEVWVESALIAAFVMVLLLDWLMLVLQFLVGISLAVIAYCLTTYPIVLGPNYLTHLAIFSFAVAIGAVANYDQDRIQIEQERAMLATAGSVAHELRTPRSWRYAWAPQASCAICLRCSTPICSPSAAACPCLKYAWRICTPCKAWLAALNKKHCIRTRSSTCCLPRRASRAATCKTQRRARSCIAWKPRSRVFRFAKATGVG